MEGGTAAAGPRLLPAVQTVQQEVASMPHTRIPTSQSLGTMRGPTPRSAPCGSVNHWEELSRHWDQVGAPLRPSPRDVAFYQRAVDELASLRSPLRAMILGVTPELYRLEWPTGSSVGAVDRNEVMIRAIWPGPPEAVHRGEWTELEMDADSQDIVLCDGGLQLLQWPAEHRTLARHLGRVLAPGGTFVVRMFVPPGQPESVTTVVDDLLAGRIANLNILKIRLGMAMSRGAPPSVRLCDVWEAVNRVAPDLQALAHRIAWPLEHLLAIHTYRDQLTEYVFVNVEQIRKAFCDPGAFELHRVDVPDYSLGERCPTVTLRRL